MSESNHCSGETKGCKGTKFTGSFQDHDINHSKIKSFNRMSGRNHCRADLGSGQVKGVTLAMAQCKVQASERLLPGGMALCYQVIGTGSCCLKGGQGGWGVGGLRVLPAH